jgi:hypothetical protein
MIQSPFDHTPFKELDAYTDEAFIWATEVWKGIAHAVIENLNPVEFPDGLDFQLLSIAYVKIYDGFLHTSMGYAEINTEDYLREVYGKQNIEKEWDLVWKYASLVYTETKTSLGGDYQLFMTLWQSILIPRDDGEWVEPYDFDRKGSFQYVLNGFVL